MRRRDLAHAAGAGHATDAPVLEAARGRRLEESVRGSDRGHGGEGPGQRRAGHGRQQRVVHDRVRRGGVRGHCARVSHGAARGRVEGPVVSTAAVDLAHEPLHLLQRVTQHQDVVPREQQRGDLGEFTHGRAVRVGHDLPQPVHGHVQVVHPLALAAVDLEADGLQLVLRQKFAVFFRQPQSQRLLLSEAAQPGLRRVTLCGRHCPRETVHRLLQSRHEDVVHLRRRRSAGHAASV